MLSQNQRDEFQTRGLLRLPGLVSPSAAGRMENAVWEFLDARDGISRTAPATWPTGEWGARPTKLKELNIQTVFDAACPAAMRKAMGELMQAPPAPFGGAGARQVLVTFPNAESWSLPHNVWHTDIPHQPGTLPINGVQAFIFLNDVRATGGGTCVLAGSHAARAEGEMLSSADYKKWLKENSPVAQRLFDAATPNRESLLDGDEDLSVTELTGQPGDVWLMDMRCLHTLAPNAAQTPRIMLTWRFKGETRA